ncbi:class III lanthionine synthetase LanKC [Pediococcus acidilactici]|uniref:class III lanthionine synthetase LanKC n=1 Tax=Pediococcus acidilactici TaxID=1254 RepID=UPI0019505E4B|nr:class III lanthionine synthetase LanKC [Pediococcus acidilactici]MBM6586268.1 class III lanthionine synthetase LanKC [Pediococcus acidilactici]
MSIDMEGYMKFIKRNNSLFYAEFGQDQRIKKFSIYKFNKNDWEQTFGSDWTYMMYDQKNLPIQGWKIHISANINDAQDVLLDVSKFLIQNKISFKYTPSAFELNLTYSKSKGRIETGKFITVYPKTEKVFCELLEPLRKITEKYEEGPYILTDKPWKQSNVYYRYGAFEKMIGLKNGLPTHMIKDPKGNFIEDKREPQYEQPSFIKEPEYVMLNNIFPDSKEFDGLKELNISGALHFSSSGGIYKGRYQNRDVVIKEGRPNIGLSYGGRDGFTRVLDEYETLLKLKDVEGVVNAIGLKKIWKHNYLIEEVIDGLTIGDYIALKYPYANTFEVEEYKQNTIKIINFLMGILEEIHSKGIALVDVQPENIIVTNSETNPSVKIIDFESSKPVESDFIIDLVVPEYAAFRSKNFGEADWYSFYKVARYLFLPVISTMFFNNELEERQNINIEKKFGKDVVQFLNKIRKKCEKYTNIYRKPPFYTGYLQLPRKEFSRNNILENISGLKRGLIKNIDFDDMKLIHGDVKQFDTLLSAFTINYGAFGVINAINRVDDNYFVENKGFDNWLSNAKKRISKIATQDPEVDLGLYTGIAGIALSAYDLNEIEFAEELFQKNEFNSKSLDISIYSGLSGIGFANLSLFAETKKSKYKKNAIEIANQIVKRFESGEFDKQKDFEGNFSLIKGWGGASFYLWKVSFLLNMFDYRQKALDILDKILEEGIVRSDRGISLLDKNKRLQRLLPYLENGFAGLALILIDMDIDDKKIIEQKYGEILTGIKNDMGSFCSVLGSLFSGTAGLIVGANAVLNYFDKDEYLDNFVNALNNYAVSTDGEDVLMPGIVGYKCSMDYETGAAGVMLSLLDCKYNHNSWFAWFPLLKDNKLNLFNKNKSCFLGE